MDTFKLTKMAYESLRLAELVPLILCPELGYLANDPMTEDEVLKGWLRHVLGIEKNPLKWVESCFLTEKEIDIEALKGRLAELRGHIEMTIATPYDKRGGPHAG